MSVQRIQAAYLPGLAASEVQWQVLRYQQGAARLEVEVPVLSAAQMTALAERVQSQAALHLKTMTVSQIIQVIDRAIARLLDPQDPYRQQADAWLPVVSGYDADMVRLGLTGFFKTFRAPQLQRFVAEDFANPKVLDEFQPAAKGGLTRAYGPSLLVHSWAGNVPALPLWSLICGLLVKAGTIGKLPSAEPLFAGWFARLLADVHPPLAECLAVVWWRGAGAQEADALYARADTVVAYGGNASLASVQSRLPVTTRFLGYGHKLGFGVISASALDALKGPALARRAAWDVMRYDQQGCYSPQVFYVQRGGKLGPREFAAHLAGELSKLHQRFPRRAPDLAESAALAKWRQAREWTPGAGQLLGDPESAWSVSYTDEVAPLMPTALQRSIVVAGIDTLNDVLPALAGLQAYLQTAGVAATPQELHALAERLGAAGVTRISAIGSMSSPEAGWHHDGRFNLLDLVRMTEIEQSAELAADPYAPYEP